MPGLLGLRAILCPHQCLPYALCQPAAWQRVAMRQPQKWISDGSNSVTLQMSSS